MDSHDRCYPLPFKLRASLETMAKGSVPPSLLELSGPYQLP